MNETIHSLILAKGNIKHLSSVLAQAWAALLTNNQLIRVEQISKEGSPVQTADKYKVTQYSIG